MTEELRLSVSKTKTFLDCKAKYKYVYIDKLPRKEWSYHILGKFCHKVLEDFHNAYVMHDSKLPFNVEMGNAYKSAIKEFGSSMNTEMKKECWDLVDKYLRIIVNNKKNNTLPNVIACEKNFNFELEENLILNGMIDRIQIDADNVLHVADYKTTKNKKYLKNDFFQLLTYAYALLLEDPNLTKIRASYILLRHDFEYITTEFNQDDIIKIKDKYISYAKQIRDEKEFTPNPTILCRYCDHASICPEVKKMLDPSQIYGEVGW